MCASAAAGSKDTNEAACMNSSTEATHFADMRQRMVEFQLRSRGIRDLRVLDAMARVPRHEFTPPQYRERAYEDHPLPIGEEQTISQPYIVALMLEALRIQPGDRVLEVGTGSGYVTAILAEITSNIISIDRHASLADRARELLTRLGYERVKVVAGDGSLGYPESAPHDVILVSAAAREIPRALIDQLDEAGRMIVPVGDGDSQVLKFVRKENGEIRIESREFCRFVPLISG
jgi:protein-L-isoaspartate(D-aspartate) O-methyltransferase